MGQYSGRGPTAMWAMNPSAKGILLLSLNIIILKP